MLPYLKEEILSSKNIFFHILEIHIKLFIFILNKNVLHIIFQEFIEILKFYIVTELTNCITINSNKNISIYIFVIIRT